MRQIIITIFDKIDKNAVEKLIKRYYPSSKNFHWSENGIALGLRLDTDANEDQIWAILNQNRKEITKKIEIKEEPKMESRQIEKSHEQEVKEQPKEILHDIHKAFALSAEAILGHVEPIFKELKAECAENTKATKTIEKLLYEMDSAYDAWSDKFEDDFNKRVSEEVKKSKEEVELAKSDMLQKLGAKEKELDQKLAEVKGTLAESHRDMLRLREEMASVEGFITGITSLSSKFKKA